MWLPAAAAAEPPGPPQDVSGQQQADGTFTLSWQPPASGDADGYRVYENGGLLAEVDALSYNVASALPASVYTVTAFNRYGESQHSHPVLDTPMGNDPACYQFPAWIQPNECRDVVVNIIWEILCPGSLCALTNALDDDGPTVMD